MKKKAIVVGAGVAGMACAYRLSKKGYNVLLIDKQSTTGGKIQDYQWNGFRWDTGPSLFTLPELLGELYEMEGLSYSNQFSYLKLPLVTKYFYEDFTQMDSYSDPKKFVMEVNDKLGVDASRVDAFLAQQKKTYKLLAPVFLHTPIHKITPLLKWVHLPALWRVMDITLLQPMAKVNKHWFRNSKLERIFNRYGTYNGSNPYKMPSLFNIIAHLEHNEGAYLPQKGMSQIASALRQLCELAQVETMLNKEVEEIIVEGKRAKGIRLKDGASYEADVVVSNMDVEFTYQRLLPFTKAPSFYLQGEKSTSALVFHWAVYKAGNKLDVHNILFAKDYEEEFTYLFEYKKVYHDPTVYIYISSKVVPEDAPANAENWFVMINTPTMEDKAMWENAEVLEQIRKGILKKVSAYVGIDVEQYIVHEHVTTPADIELQTYARGGSLYGASSNSAFSAFMRHPNQSPSISNLFFCGGTVHPGGGIPLCLLSAKIVADLVP